MKAKRLLIVLLVLALPIAALAAWDKNLPSGSLGVNVMDDSIRANNDWLESSLSVAMVFPGTTTTRGRPLIRKGNKAARDAVTSAQEGEFWLRTDVSPGAMDVREGGAWVRRLGPKVGDIILWSGNPATLGADRPGWALADGATVNGFVTPNLKGRFVVGYDVGDGDYNAIGDTGGEKTHALTVGEMPAHDHGGVTSSSGAASIGSTRDTNGTSADQMRGGDIGSALIDSIQTPNHTHTITSQGSGTAHENRPPFYTLAYIVFVDV